jgi:hypothetical protein
VVTQAPGSFLSHISGLSLARSSTAVHWGGPETAPLTRAMPPSFLSFKELRRRSKANFRTERSTDESSEFSHNTTPTSGSAFTDGSPPTSGSSTPPSIATQSDPALNLQSQDQPHPLQPAAVPRPHPRPNAGSNRHSVSGMVGLGSPAPEGRGPVLPVSLFSPRITNVSDGQWVSDAQGDTRTLRKPNPENQLLTSSRYIRRF